MRRRTRCARSSGTRCTSSDRTASSGTTRTPGYTEPPPGFWDRGRIREGLRADLVLLDPATFIDRATYDEPARTPDGVVGVWVAGRSVWRAGTPSGARPGGVWREPRRAERPVL